jgi:NAD(P)-dependent dehydrogenase (short-subunit alcohol dehydrogenase family)
VDLTARRAKEVPPVPSEPGDVLPGGAGVFIASMAGTIHPADPDLDVEVALTPTDELLALRRLQPDMVPDAAVAYGVAKRGNQVRVRAASSIWGERRARVNSISPGIIATPMGNAELDGPNGEVMRMMTSRSGTGRVGTPADVAAAAAFLAGPDAGFVTGTDLLVDGGVTAALLAGTPWDG